MKFNIFVEQSLIAKNSKAGNSQNVPNKVDFD